MNSSVDQAKAEGLAKYIFEKLPEKEYKMIVKYRPENGVIYFNPRYTKGDFVTSYLANNGIKKNAYVAAMGDDTIDEPMFSVLRRLGKHSVVVSTKNGKKPTVATERLQQPEDVLRLLQTLAQSRTVSKRRMA